MSKIYVSGGKKLRGSIAVQGSKNAALPMMAAALLNRGISVLKGCPRIADVFCMEEILRKLGAVTRWEDHDLYLDCTAADGTVVAESDARRMRSSVILLGVMLARNGEGSIGYPGGCVIGKRPVDLHKEVLSALGAELNEEEHSICGACGRLKGCSFTFGKSSVGATQQGILAAVTAEGETVLGNCALEPEVVWLCRFLKEMGARIRGEGTRCIRIEGVERLGAGEIRVPPDRIAAGTYICAAAVTRGEIIIENPPVEELGAFLEVYRKIGGQYEVKSGKLRVSGGQVCRPVPFLETEVYPGFPTDLQSPLTAALVTVPGRSRIREKIFEDRFRAALEMRRMGAHISVNGSEAVIEGGFPLKGAAVQAGELRGGAALVLAALGARGESCIEGAEFIRRGYEHICEDLRALGSGEISED